MEILFEIYAVAKLPYVKSDMDAWVFCFASGRNTFEISMVTSELFVIGERPYLFFIEDCISFVSTCTTI